MQLPTLLAEMLAEAFAKKGSPLSAEEALICAVAWHEAEAGERIAN